LPHATHRAGLQKLSGAFEAAWDRQRWPEMKTYREFVEENGLSEGFLRKGAITTYAAASRKSGDKAVQSYRRAKQALNRNGQTKSVDERLEGIEISLEAIIVGLIHQRDQAGNAVAVDVAGHLLISKLLKQKNRDRLRKK